jgi:uncharacterized protein (DUF362 family)
MVDGGIRSLTGYSNAVQGLESLFPGIDATKKIFIKVNLINGTIYSRPEVARALVVRLLEMCGGFPAANITISDRYTMSSYGYTTSFFGANINLVNGNPRSSHNDAPVYYSYTAGNLDYSNALYNCDYFINLPVLKDHGNSRYDFTLALKNHYGNFDPRCGESDGRQHVLEINAGSVVKNKTCLIVLDAIYGVYNGGPGGGFMEWQTCPQGEPFKLLFSTDPVTIDYWGRKIINAERAARGMREKAGEYIELAAGAPYKIGVAEESSMQVINL